MAANKNGPTGSWPMWPTLLASFLALGLLSAVALASASAPANEMPERVPVPVDSGNIPADTPTNTPTDTPTPTPTGQTTLVCHLTWNGISQPNTRNIGMRGILTLCSAGVPVSYTVSTDTRGSFTVTTNLPDGAYSWRFKGGSYFDPEPQSYHKGNNLATSGTLIITGGVANPELGKQKAGDGYSDDLVGISDFGVLKGEFGHVSCFSRHDGSFVPGRSDFNHDCLINTTDFNLMKNNFGHGGALLNCP